MCILIKLCAQSHHFSLVFFFLSLLFSLPLVLFLDLFCYIPWTCIRFWIRRTKNYHYSRMNKLSSNETFTTTTTISGQQYHEHNKDIKKFIPAKNKVKASHTDFAKWYQFTFTNRRKLYPKCYFIAKYVAEQLKKHRHKEDLCVMFQNVHNKTKQIIPSTDLSIKRYSNFSSYKLPMLNRSPILPEKAHAK